MCPSLIQIGSKTAEKNSAQTNRQTDRQTNRHYENNGHLAVNQLTEKLIEIHFQNHVQRTDMSELSHLIFGKGVYVPYLKFSRRHWSCCLSVWILRNV